jgi:hypothetical protein
VRAVCIYVSHRAITCVDTEGIATRELARLYRYVRLTVRLRIGVDGMTETRGRVPRLLGAI